MAGKVNLVALALAFLSTRARASSGAGGEVPAVLGGVGWRSEEDVRAGVTTTPARGLHTIPNASATVVAAVGPGCSAAFGEEVFRAFIDDTCLSQGSDLLLECPVDAAEEFLVHYGADLKLLNQIFTIISTVAQTALIYAGTVPARNGSQLGLVLWYFWLGLQIVCAFIYLLSGLLAVVAYVNLTSLLSSCLVRLGAAPVLHILAVLGLAAHPISALRLYAVMVTVDNLAQSGQWSERTTKVLHRVAVAPFLVLACVSVIIWVGSASIFFSALFLPVPVITFAVAQILFMALKEISHSMGQGDLFSAWSPVPWWDEKRESVLGKLLSHWFGSAAMTGLLWLVLSPWIWVSSLFALATYRGAGAGENVQLLGMIYRFTFSSVELRLPNFADLGPLTDFRQAVEALASVSEVFLNMRTETFMEGSRFFFTASVILSTLKVVVIHGNTLLFSLTQHRCGAPPEAVDPAQVLLELEEGTLARENLPAELLSQRDFVLQALQVDAYVLALASHELRGDKEVVLAALRTAGGALQYASQALRGDRELVLEAVSHDAEALRYASRELREDKQVVLAAVRTWGAILAYASQQLCEDKDVVLEAVRSAGNALYYASQDLRKDKEVALQAVRSDGWALDGTFRDLRDDKEVVLEAVRSDGGALRYASSALRQDKEVVLEAVRRSSAALVLASDNLRGDKDVVLEAVRRNGDALWYASEDMRQDKEVVREAVRSGGDVLWYISPDLCGDRDVVLEAVRRKGWALRYASPDLRGDREVVLEAVRNDGDALWYASKDLRGDKDVVQQAVLTNGEALQYASQDIREEEEELLEAGQRGGSLKAYEGPRLNSCAAFFF